MKSKKTVTYIIILTLGVLALVNVLANRFFFRLDLTEDNRYTLSNATKNILRDLDETVTVKAYFSGNLTTDFDNVKREFKDMLTEYSNISRGMLVYEFIDPLESEELEKEAMEEGVVQAQIQSREKDEIKVQKAYLGAVVFVGEESEAIPTIQSGIGMEYSLSTAIKKLTVHDKETIGFLQGQGEPGLNQMQQIMYLLQVMYDVAPVTLSDSTSELDRYQTLAIVAPTDSFSASDLRQLDEFMARGGKMFIAINRVDADLNQYPVGHSVNTGLETWLSRKGVNMNDNFVVDDNCVPIGVQMQQGPFTMTRQIPFHYFPVLINFADHPASSGLEQVYFQFVSSINFSGDSSVVFTPLVKTSEKSGTLPSTTYFDLNKEWADGDFPLSGLTLAAALEGPIESNTSTRMVVIGDGDFPVGAGQQGQIHPDNANLMVNSIDWLTDDTGLIELRTKGATIRPLDDLEDATRATLKWLNFLLPIILVIVYGIFRSQRKQITRIKRMEVGHV